MAIDIVARALAVSGKQNLENYYNKTESDARYVKQSRENISLVYGRTNNTEVGIKYAAYPIGNSIPLRLVDGRLQSADPTEDLDVVNKQYGESNYYQVTNGTNIPENADLNTYTTPGTYQAANDTIGKTIKNTPYNYGFKLIVEIYASAALRQRVFGQAATDLWERTKKGTAWSDWVKIATTSYVDNKTAVLIDNSLLGA